ncbi:hypothetical protein IQ07DRAFT_610875 [Pyrenochaeta sp. DS3sAY3a]|nr:hypothetical protein IQ07DRAFT_610875 [Pyrenochaeta sp. DS3sAY3a]
MSHSPPSSAGHGPSSSPFAGTDPTLYSPELVRALAQVQVTTDGTQAGHHVDSNLDQYALTLPAPAPYVQGAFVNEIAPEDRTYISRFQFVTRLPDGTMAGTDKEHELFTVQHQMKLYTAFHKCVPMYEKGVHLRFDDLHDSTEGKDILEAQGFNVEYITSYDFAIAKGQDTALLNEFEGQIKVPIMIQPGPGQTTKEFPPGGFLSVTRNLMIIANTFRNVPIAPGNATNIPSAVRNCIHVDTDVSKGIMIFRVEFHSVDAALRAVQSLCVDRVWGYGDEKAFRWDIVNPTLWTGERPLNSPHRNNPRIDDQGRLYGYRTAQRMNPNSPYQAYRHPHDQHNRVRRDHILDGSDVRTTVMLRNIPNKLDWMSLKTILDTVCFGTYDFLYLRIDFTSGNGVGYAFINFSDVQGMISLIDQVEGRLWAGYNSNKAAEISYATIQGREALIQKFRNSSVMQETPFCRPRLFLTFADPLSTNQIRRIGTEQAFPRPDNMSKLQRSMDSARSIGLYPPHGGSTLAQHRNRVSAFDRGSPRDVQSMGHYGSRMVQPGEQFTLAHLPTVTAATKRDIEVWYANTIGTPTMRYRFDNIPLPFISSYLNAHPEAYQMSPGIIGTRGSGSNDQAPNRHHRLGPQGGNGFM